MGPRSPRRLVALAAAAGFALTACGGDSPESFAAPSASSASSPSDIAFGLVSSAEAAALAVDEGVSVIDVRTPEEFAEGQLGGATMIDFYTDSFADEIAALDRDGTYLLYCRSGNRSGQAHELMEQLGFEHVYDLDGGVLAWQADGRGLTP